MGQASSQAAGAEHSKAKPIGMLVAAVGVVYYRLLTYFFKLSQMEERRAAYNSFRLGAEYGFHPKFVSFISNELAGLEKRKIIDVGGGDGTLWDKLPHLKPAVTIVDIAQYKTWSGKRIVADTEKLPLRSGAIDSVVSTFGLDYSNKVSALAEIRRVLKGGGKLVLLMHHPDSDIVKNYQKDNKALGLLREVFENLSTGTSDEKQLHELDYKLWQIYGTEWKNTHFIPKDKIQELIRPSKTNSEPSDRLSYQYRTTIIAKTLAENIRKRKGDAEEVKQTAKKILADIQHQQIVLAPLVDEQRVLREKELKQLLESSGFQKVAITPIFSEYRGERFGAFGIVAEKH